MINNERDTKYMDNDDLDRPIPSFNPALSMITSSIYKDDDEFGSVKSERMKAGIIRRRRSSAVSHCSSHCSMSSRHPLRRRRRRRLKSTTEMSEATVAQLNLDIEQLNSSFTTCCTIVAEKSARDKEKPSTSSKAVSSKRGGKKRKTAVEVAETNSPSTATPSTTTKRRNKKTVQTKSPDDHKLPLKKRHYLMSTSGEKADASAKNITDDECGNALANTDAVVVGKAITPKKRHLIQTPDDLNDVVDSTDATSSSTCRDLQETQAAVSLSISDGDTTVGGKSGGQVKKIDATRKRVRLEGLVLKISPMSPTNATDGKQTVAAVSRSPSVQKNLTTKGQSGKHLATKDQSSKHLSTKDQAKVKHLSTKDQSAKHLSTKDQGGKHLSTKDQGTKRLSTKDHGTKQLSTKEQSNQNLATKDKQLATKDQSGKHLSTKDQGSKHLSTTDQAGKHLSTKDPGAKHLSTKDQSTRRLSTKSQPTKSVTTKGQSVTSPKTPTSSKQTAAPLDPSPKTSSRAASAARASRPDEAPPGVFEPSGAFDLELQIPYTEIPIRQAHKPLDVANDSIPMPAAKAKKSPGKSDCVIEKLLHRTSSTAPTPPKKKRKKPNRTGFPTVKKKKKPLPRPGLESTEAAPVENGNDSPLPLARGKSSAKDLSKQGDHILVADETTGTFNEHNTNLPRLVVVSLDRLQNESANEKMPTKKQQLTDLTVNEDDNEVRNIVNTPKSPATASGRKSRLLITEPIPSGRRGRSSANTPQTDDVVKSTTPAPTLAGKATKSTRNAATGKAQPGTAATPDPIESRGHKKRSPPSSTEFISRCVKKRSTPEGEESTEAGEDETEKPSKRKHNGKVVDKANDNMLPLRGLIDTVDNARGSKRARHDTSGTENKPTKNNKRPLAIHHSQQENVKAKRSRLEATRETSKTPTPSRKTPDQAAVEETVTSYEDIPSVDDWVPNSTHSEEPLPLDENINHVESAEELVSDREGGKRSKPKKRFISAGLFSNYFKEDHPPADKATKSSNGADKKSAAGQQQSDESLLGTLTPMPFYANEIMHKEVDFQLPYDLWYARETEKLAPKNIVQSWNFKKIRINLYTDSALKPAQSSDLSQCCCKSDSACGEMCLNRLVYTECDPETCPCGSSCQNTKIQRHIVARTERFMTVSKGWGVRAQEVIRKGTYILEYVGEVVTDREFKERMHTVYTNDIHHYCLHLDKGLVIDGHRMGSDCRFVNHSCEPNCEMQKWSVNGLPRMALFAMDDIEPGQELTYDYNFSLFNPAEGQVCRCGSKECRGVIGGKSQRVRPIEGKVSSKCHILSWLILYFYQKRLRRYVRKKRVRFCKLPLFWCSFL